MMGHNHIMAGRTTLRALLVAIVLTAATVGAAVPTAALSLDGKGNDPYPTAVSASLDGKGNDPFPPSRYGSLDGTGDDAIISAFPINNVTVVQRASGLVSAVASVAQDMDPFVLAQAIHLDAPGQDMDPY